MSEKIERIKLNEIQEDDLNANRHTERGDWMVRNSIQNFGFAEAGTLDKNNRIIGGHKRTEAAADVLGAEEAIIIEVDGTRPIFIKRKDLDLNDPKVRELAIALNRSAQVSIDFDPVVLAELDEMEVSLDSWFSEKELEELFAQEIGDFSGLGENPETDNETMITLNVTASERTAQKIMEYLDGLKGVSWKRI